MSDVLHAVADALYVYPVKACAGLRVDQLQFSEQGLIAGDREWVVVNADSGEVVWQGSHPRLALVHPRVAPGWLHLSGPEGRALAVPHPPRGAACQVKIWNSSLQCNEAFDGIDAGDAACAWLQNITGTALRLVRLEAAALARCGRRGTPVGAGALHTLHRAQCRPANRHAYRATLGDGHPTQCTAASGATRILWHLCPRASGGNLGRRRAAGIGVEFLGPQCGPAHSLIGPWHLK